jgi:hypothetical protein
MSIFLNFINNINKKNKINKINNINEENININLIIKNLVLEYSIKKLNMIQIVDKYNFETNIINDKDLVNKGRKTLIIELNKIKEKESDKNQILLDNLINKLIKNINNHNIKYIIDIYQNEANDITKNSTLIHKYKNILIIKLNEKAF